MTIAGARAPCFVLAAAFGLAASAGAQTVERVARSLKEVPSTFARAADAPRSEFRQAGPASQLGGAATPSTVFRVAEVPPARVAATRELLQTLQAR